MIDDAILCLLYVYFLSLGNIKLTREKIVLTALTASISS